MSAHEQNLPQHHFDQIDGPVACASMAGQHIHLTLQDLCQVAISGPPQWAGKDNLKLTLSSNVTRPMYQSWCRHTALLHDEHPLLQDAQNQCFYQQSLQAEICLTLS